MAAAPAKADTLYRLYIYPHAFSGRLILPQRIPCPPDPGTCKPRDPYENRSSKDPDENVLRLHGSQCEAQNLGRVDCDYAVGAVCDVDRAVHVIEEYPHYLAEPQSHHCQVVAVEAQSGQAHSERCQNCRRHRCSCRDEEGHVDPELGRCKQGIYIRPDPVEPGVAKIKEACLAGYDGKPGRQHEVYADRSSCPHQVVVLRDQWDGQQNGIAQKDQDAPDGDVPASQQSQSAKKADLSQTAGERASWSSLTAPPRHAAGAFFQGVQKIT